MGRAKGREGGGEGQGRGEGRGECCKVIVLYTWERTSWYFPINVAVKICTPCIICKIVVKRRNCNNFLLPKLAKHYWCTRVTWGLGVNSAYTNKQTYHKTTRQTLYKLTDLLSSILTKKHHLKITDISFNITLTWETNII